MPNKPPATPKVRLDQIMLEQGFAETREKAQRMIRAGQVREGTRVLDKPGARMPADAMLEVTALRDRFVSRGGWKLEAAFEAFSLKPCPAVCADIGASTGGFTDCLLQHGARKVYAIDVGSGQIDRKLRDDPRVTLMENTNARFLTPQSLPEPVDLVVTDVSFISLRLILPAAAALLAPERGMAVVLVKPQFEAGPADVGKGGVVRDPAVHRRVLREIALEAAPAAGFLPSGLAPSPVLGPAGNREYLLWLTREADAQNQPVIGLGEMNAAVEAAFRIKSSEH